jgi:hypothetical protein
MSPFGDWFNEVFRLYSAQWQVYVLQSLIVVAFSAIFPIIGYLAMIGTMIATVTTASTTRGEPNPVAMFGGMALLYGGLFLASFVVVFLLPGMVHTALKQIRGEPISVGDLFSAMRYGWGYLAINMLLFLISVVTCGLGGILGLLAIGVIALAHALMVDQDMPTFQAIGQGWEICKRNFGLYFLFPLVVSLLANAGSMVCGIGVIGTFGFLPIGVAVMYMRTYHGPQYVPPFVPGMATPPSYMPPPYAGGQPMAPTSACPNCGAQMPAGATACPNCGRGPTV